AFEEPAVHIAHATDVAEIDFRVGARIKKLLAIRQNQTRCRNGDGKRDCSEPGCAFHEVLQSASVGLVLLCRPAIDAASTGPGLQEPPFLVNEYSNDDGGRNDPGPTLPQPIGNAARNDVRDGGADQP